MTCNMCKWKIFLLHWTYSFFFYFELRSYVIMRGKTEVCILHPR